MIQTKIYQALHIKYVGPTDTKPSRWRVKTSAGTRFFPRDLSLREEDDVRRVAEAYCAKLGWPYDNLYIGQLYDASWCAVQVKE